MKERQYFVYILTNSTRTVLYVGITNDLERRIWEHQNKITQGFTARYNLKFLIYYEIYSDPTTAIEREKQIKSWSRRRKEELIATTNSDWRDLMAEIATSAHRASSQ